MKAFFKKSAPELRLPGQRKISGGKNLDGSFFMLVEGIPEPIKFTPEAWLHIATSMLETAGVKLEKINPGMLNP